MATIPNDEFLNDARKRMVESQLRPNKVTDTRILTAARQLPRERFLPPSLLPLAYSDQNVVLGLGRVLLQPMALARLAQAAAPVKGEAVLIVGAATGYSAALLAALGCSVIALEEPGVLADLAKTALTEVAPSVSLVSGPLAAGWSTGAPYDLILIDGAVPEVPSVLMNQLNRQTGRLVTIVNTGGGTSHAVLARPTPVGVSMRALFDCPCPVIPGFAAAPAFVF
ncbi:MAG: protein-L-isoaspartate O-methyltransferase [Acetobacteraceae bacterium]|nr:protein-L-isoaspartate O-methyltransferase [Acetobacteraceae bacterium]